MSCDAPSNAFEEAACKSAAARSSSVADVIAGYQGSVIASGYRGGGEAALASELAAAGQSFPTAPTFPWALVGGAVAALGAVYFIARRRK